MKTGPSAGVRGFGPFFGGMEPDFGFAGLGFSRSELSYHLQDKTSDRRGWVLAISGVVFL